MSGDRVSRSVVLICADESSSPLSEAVGAGEAAEATPTVGGGGSRGEACSASAALGGVAGRFRFPRQGEAVGRFPPLLLLALVSWSGVDGVGGGARGGGSMGWDGGLSSDFATSDGEGPSEGGTPASQPASTSAPTILASPPRTAS